MGKLTATKVKSLTAPGRYSDGDGLFLEVKPAGGRNWILRVLCGGKRRDIGLGPLKSVNLGDAREAAHQIRRQIARGLDPIAERKRERQVIPSSREATKTVHREHKASWKNGTVHGFRSAFRDWVAEQTNYPGDVAEAALAHSVSNKVEAAYRRTDFLAKRRELMRDWGCYCFAAVNP